MMFAKSCQAQNLLCFAPDVDGILGGNAEELLELKASAAPSSKIGIISSSTAGTLTSS
jgi:hypothetical protein